MFVFLPLPLPVPSPFSPSLSASFSRLVNKQMAHSLPVPKPGQSEAQNEAQGDDFSTNTTANAAYPRGPFESAMRLWLCELPQSDSLGKDLADGFHWPCDGTHAAGPPGSEAVGHAENLKDAAFTKVGCFYEEVTATAEDQNPVSAFFVDVSVGGVTLGGFWPTDVDVGGVDVQLFQHVGPRSIVSGHGH